MILGVLVGIGLSHGLSDDSPDSVEVVLEDRLAEIQAEYAETTIDDEAWLAEELLLLEDPETERIMRDAVRVDGVGAARAFRIAEFFDADWEAYQQADAEAFEQVNGIGPNRGTALAEK